MELLRKLSQTNGNQVRFKALKYEVVTDSLAGQQKVVEEIVQKVYPTIFVRHYSFLDLESFQYPSGLVEWFNVVRHPVEKVISFFHYR